MTQFTFCHKPDSPADMAASYGLVPFSIRVSFYNKLAVFIAAAKLKGIYHHASEIEYRPQSENR
jgi:hypothetical protein